MTYQERRRAQRAEVKAKFLTHLLMAKADGKNVRLNDLAITLNRSRSVLTVLWHELADEGLIDYPAEERKQRAQGSDITDEDLAERIAMVREEKAKHWDRTGSLVLGKKQLKKALPE